MGEDYWGQFCVYKKPERRTGSFHTSPICLFDNLIESHNVRDIFMAIFNQVFKNASKKQVSFVRLKYHTLTDIPSRSSF